jgi:biopolymer transport protein TolR
VKIQGLGKFNKSGHGKKTEIELPLAPMASVFTVILVFLIKSAAMNVTNISPSADIDLPEITTTSQIPDALKIEISNSAIMVADKLVVSLKDFSPAARNPSSTTDEANPFKALEKALDFERGEGVEKDSKIVIIADKNAPYGLMKQVMASAASVGFLDLKLVVVEGN